MTKNEKMLVDALYGVIGALATTASELAKSRKKKYMIDGLSLQSQRTMERAYKVIEKMEDQ